MKNFLYWYYENKAFKAFISGDYPKAEELFQKMEEKFRDRIDIGHNIGLVRLAMKDYERAETSFLKEINDYGETLGRMRVLGDLYYAWGKAAKAKKAYESALENAASERSPSKETDIFFIKKRIEICSSEEVFELAGKAESEIEKGVQLLAAKQCDEAYEHFEKALAFDPICFPAINNMGVIALNNRKDYTDAIMRFKEVCKISSNPQAKRNLEHAEKAKKEAEKIKNKKT